MGNRRKGVVALSCLAGWLLAAAAEPQDTKVIDLDEALGVVETMPEVVAARAGERAATARVELAKRPAEPALTLETKSITARESLTLSVPFRWGGQRAAEVRTARAESDAAARSRDVALATARHAVTVAWYTLGASEERLRAARGQTERADRNRRAVADLLEVQRGSKLDAARAATDAATAEAELAVAEQEVTAASAELGALIDAGTAHLSSGASQRTPPAEDLLDPWLERARASDPELALAAAEVAAAEAVVSQRDRLRLPATTLEAGADWNDPTQPGTDAMIGLGITFPTRSHAALEVARAEQARVEAIYAQTQRRLDAAVVSAWAGARAARLRFQALDGQARPAAMEAAELTRIGYTEGRLDVFRLLEAERVLAETERNRADAYRDWGVAFAQLERLAPRAQP